MSVLGRLSAAFLEPAPAASCDWAPPVALPAPREAATTLALLCAGREARLAGGAAGLALVRATGAPTAIVCEWGAERSRVVVPFSTPAAARTAAVFVEHGLDAIASGRLVRVTLPDDDAGAARAGRLVLDEAIAPHVLVVAGAREEELDALVARHPRALVAADGGLADLAMAELGATAAVIDLSAPHPAALLAQSGIALLAPLRERFGNALG